MSPFLRGALGAACAGWILAAAGAVSAGASPPPPGATVLVRIDPGATRDERAQVSRALDAEAVRPLMAGWRAYRLDEPISLARARGLLHDADAAGAVQLDVVMHPLSISDDPLVDDQWPLPKIAAPAGWVRAAGAAPVTVAVLDSGVNVSHGDLSSRVWQNPGETANGMDDDKNGLIDDLVGWDFASGNASVYDAGDGDTHGTHVAGTIAARRDNAVGVAGVSDNARIMALKFIRPGGGATSHAIAGIQYAVSKGARVINGSFGSTSYSPALCDAIAAAGAQGVLFVAAAGNAGTNNDQTPFWPANCPAATLLSVAATTSSDGLASYSNRGKVQVDVGAPGGDGGTLDAGDVLSLYPGNQYTYNAGTSMAAPHVSAAAASALGIRPELVPWQLITAIVEGGDPVASLATTTSTGRRLNLDGTLRVAATGVPDVTPPSPPAPLEPADGLATVAEPAFRWSPAGDLQSGVAAHQLRIDGAAAATVGPGMTAVVPSPLSEGRHTWDVLAVDRYGNQSVSASRVLVVDRTPPAAALPSSPAGGARRPVGGVTLAWLATTDSLSGLAGYRVEVDGVPAASVAPDVTSVRVPLTRARHSWRVVALDAAGNATTGPARSVVVGPPPPPRLTLRVVGKVAPGARPLLRVRLTRAARVLFRVRPVSGGGTASRFARTLRSGRSAVRLPASVASRLRPSAVYRITARPAGGAIASARVSVAGRP